LINTDTYELTQMINRNNHEVSETMQDINTLVSDIRNNPKELANKLEEDKNLLADRTNSCPRCGERLIIVDKDYFNYDYLGQEGVQSIDIYGCDNSSCGYIKE